MADRFEDDIEEIHGLLETIMAGNQERIHAWLHDRNVIFHSLSPMDMIGMGLSYRVALVLRSYASDSQIFRG